MIEALLFIILILALSNAHHRIAELEKRELLREKHISSLASTLNETQTIVTDCRDLIQSSVSRLETIHPAH